MKGIMSLNTLGRKKKNCYRKGDSYRNKCKVTGISVILVRVCLLKTFYKMAQGYQNKLM